MSVTECPRFIRQKKIWWLQRDTSIIDSKIKEAYFPPYQSLIEKALCKIMNNILNIVLTVNTVSFDCFILCPTKVQFRKGRES